MNALVALDAMSLAPADVASTLGVLLKNRDDLSRFGPAEVAKLVA